MATIYKFSILFCVGLIFTLANGEPLRVKRQNEDGGGANEGEEPSVEQLCEGRPGDEYFRLTIEGDCRDVVRCDQAGENGITRLAGVRCPNGLAFDIDRQTCDWKTNVKNCDQIEKPRKILPILKTDEPVCPEGKLSCGNGECLDKSLFCDDKPDCKDESDENACSVDSDPNRAPDCDPTQCALPDCFCSADGTRIPGAIEPNQVPQMITITFNGAVNVDNSDLYDEIFNGNRQNPNGCQIKGTFFVSHKYTNYSAVQETHRKGHEIAVHSITKGVRPGNLQHNDDEAFWSNATVDDWAKEMAGMRIISEKYANLTDNSVVGVRAPYLRVGGNNQFTMMEEQAFLYDSSITAPLSNPPLWPYTMYFRMPHRCHGNLQHCPTRSHAVWEMVMNELDRREDPNFDEYLAGCAMVDSCSNILTGDQFYNFLNHNFDRHYDQNRAPLGLYFHAAWLKNNPEFLDAFLYWVDEILERHKDVYFVTMTQVIQWIQNPRTITEVKNFDPWREKCAVEGNPACWVPHACRLTSKEVPGETINLQTCVRCPNNYPWLNDPTGDGFF
uniref:Chitin-binding type-2 domain-containing protein n=1 Tax=Cacopsylla melanoneura TaxID=428564 RepID=A0A8D8XGB1_9HEMI